MVKRATRSNFTPGLILFLLGSLAGTGVLPAWSAEQPPDPEEPVLYRLENEGAEGNALQQKAREAVESGVPAGITATVIEHCLERGIDGKSVARLLEGIISAHEEGLPASPLASKVLEGLAKGVNSRKILTALEKVRERMETASRIISWSGHEIPPGGHREQLIIELSNALAAGLGPDQLADMLQTAAGNLQYDGGVGLVDITEMAAILTGYGVDYTSVRDLVETVTAAKDFTQEDLRSFVLRFVDDRRKGREGAETGDIGTDHSDIDLPDAAEPGLDAAEDASERGDSGRDTADEASGGRSRR